MIQNQLAIKKRFLLHEWVITLWKYRELVVAMSRREITDRYAGQVLGTLWAIGHPLFLMGIYVTVFVFVFGMKTGLDQSQDYTLYLLTGLIPWLTCQDAMFRTSTVIISHTSLVKQVAFPVEILPVKSILACLPSQVISTILLFTYAIWTHGVPPIIWVLWPLLFGMQVVGLVGLGYLLASCGAFIRDLKDVLTVLCTGGLFCLPIFYRIDQLPEWARPFIRLNPFTHLLFCYQDIFISQRIAHPWSWIGMFLISFVLLQLGFRIFRQTRMLFGNVL